MITYKFSLFRQPYHLRRLETSLLELNYSVSVAEQCASSFGVPQTRRRLILFATRRGLTQPNFPSIKYAWDSPAHLPVTTLQSAIGDLNHENPRPVSDSRNPHYPRPNCTSSRFTDFTRLLGSDKVNQIAHHATGYRRLSEQENWPNAAWDEPLCTVRTRPSNRWACVHPGAKLDASSCIMSGASHIFLDGKRLLTVRELCRIQSFPGMEYGFHVTVI
jgi:site-specific DNA-cytosine methylase